MTMPRQPKATFGFTLLEILIVVFLIATMGSIVAGTVVGLADRDRLQDESERLYYLITLISDETVITGYDLGIRFDQEGYEFYKLGARSAGKRRWELYSDDSRFERHEINEAIEFSLAIDDIEVTLPEIEKKQDTDDRVQIDSQFDDEEKDLIKPNIMILSSGEVLQSFAITLIDQELDNKTLIVRSAEENVVEIFDEEASK